MAKDNLKNKSGPDEAISNGNNGQKKTKRRPEKECLQKKAKLAGILGWEKMTVKELRRQLSTIKSEGKEVPDLRTENSGAPESLSHSPKIQEWKKQSLEEEMEMKRKDAHGNETISKKAFFLVALDLLKKDIINASNTRDRVTALHEYFDRTLGKAQQEVHFEGEIKASLQKLPTKAQQAIGKFIEGLMDAEDDDD